MSTTNTEKGGFFSNFLDKIWHQAILATGITLVWLLWILFEIYIKSPTA
jgi:hypothetical protein